MVALRFVGVSFSFHDAVPMLVGVSLHLGEGWYGLVGANGAGKSTLLSLVAGQRTPDEGKVLLEPRDALVRLVPQTVELCAPAVVDFARRDDAVARRTRAELRLQPGDLARWPSLSPGERKRWQIGAALADEPAVLLLDEPTNHLDAEARDLLVAALGSRSLIGIVASHDRDLLEELTTETLRVHAGAVEQVPGAYGAARALWEEAQRGRQAERDRRKGVLAQAERRLADARRARAGAERQISIKARSKGPKDRDARCATSRFGPEQAEKRIGRLVAVRRGEADRAVEAVGAIAVAREVGQRVFIDYRPAPRPRLVTLNEAALRMGGKTLLRDVSVVLGRHDRVHLRGPNGSGKTTLMRRLLDEAGLPADRLRYLPQDVTSDDRRGALAEVRGLDPAARGRVLSLVAALGLDPDHVLGSADPSPGEARKLLMALALGTHAWALAVDEPTNDLDLPSIERLEGALADFPGALLLVSHDERFAARVTEHVWTIRDQRLEATSRAGQPRAARG
ncbi:MAG: ATP-binding cassette domain-containing protein [Polyangiaceae bacterium]